MPKFRCTAEILKLMRKKENIRNIGVIAHIDHGKTTLTDCLLAQAGLLSPEIAGQARVLDYLEEEQKRGITIKTANISLLHEVDGCSYVVNLVDTPGHVDFTGKVARALRAIDGAVVVVDAVEEIMVQTETVTRQALEERVKPVLFINKIDRLINELKLSSAEIQNKFTRIIRDFNNLIEIYGEPEFSSKWKVDSAKETVAFGSALHKWGFTINMLKQKEIKFNEIYEACIKSEHQKFCRRLPLHEALLNMVIKNLPNPIEAQKYRLQKIWKGKIESEIGQTMVNCDDKGPTVMCITMAQMDPQIGLIATGRVFSGSIKEGDHVYLADSRKEHCVRQVFMYMGAFKEAVNEITAGNIAALTGLESARAGETLIDAKFKGVMVPFEHIKYFSDSIVTIAVEPKHSQDLPHLFNAMNTLSIEDPNLLVTVNKETGEYLLSGMGELHLEIALKFLRQYLGKIDVTASLPMVMYRESIAKQGIIAMAKSPNNQNKFWVQVEPLEEKILNLMEKSELAEEMDHKQIADLLHKELEWSEEETQKVWALEKHKNMFLNLAKKTVPTEIKNMLVSSFLLICHAGPLCGEPLRGVKIKLIDVQFSKDLEGYAFTQIIPALRRAVFSSFLSAKPILLEPVYKIGISVPINRLGKCLNIITRRRGKILSSEQKGAIATISGYIPVEESFSLSTVMHSATSGHAFWQCTFSHWKRLPENLSIEVIRKIRERKGLPQKFLNPKITRQKLNSYNNLFSNR